MTTHPAVVTVAVGAPLAIHQVPTVSPQDNEVRVRVEWTASTPLDLHQADSGLLVKHPLVLGDGVAGTVVELGPQASHLAVGDKVFGFTWRKQAEKAHQLYVTAPEFLFGKIPANITPQEAVTVPNNFVTVWHTFTADLGFELPWPKPENYTPPESNEWILVWGGSGSVGQYALQVLKYYGYKNVIATASKAHHAKLKEYGAAACFDYRDGDIVGHILDYARKSKGTDGPTIKYIYDCIGSQSGSVRPIARIAEKGSIVAILLPVIVRDAAPGVTPEYAMDVTTAADWVNGVKVLGVRTHFYLENKFLADHLQPDIMPELLEKGIIEPNSQVLVEGKTLLERAESALSKLRNKEVSGARLVWRIAEEGQK